MLRPAWRRQRPAVRGLRVIIDPAARALPPAALIGAAARRHARRRAVLASLLRRPRQLASADARRLRRARRARGATARPPAAWRGPRFPGFRLALSATCREKTYSAGRCGSSEISGAIAPSVRTPRRPSPAPSTGVSDRILHGGRLVAAVHHAVGALLVVAGAVGVPVGFFHQLLEGLGVAFAEQVAGPLPAEHGARRVAPRRAVIGLVAGEEIEEQARLAERPGLAAAAAAEECRGTAAWSSRGSGNAAGRARAHRHSRATP